MIHLDLAIWILTGLIYLAYDIYKEGITIGELLGSLLLVSILGPMAFILLFIKYITSNVDWDKPLVRPKSKRDLEKKQKLDRETYGGPI